MLQPIRTQSNWRAIDVYLHGFFLSCAFLCTLIGWAYLICIITIQLFLNSSGWSSCLPATKMQSQLLFLSKWCRKTLKFTWKNRIKYSKKSNKMELSSCSKENYKKDLIHWIMPISINTPLPILIFILCKQVNKVLVLTRIVRFLSTSS